MLRIALSTLNGRKGGMLGAFAAVALAVVLVVSCGILLDSALRTPIPVERLDSAAVIVQASPKLMGSETSAGRCPSAAGCRLSSPGAYRDCPVCARRLPTDRSSAADRPRRAADHRRHGSPPSVTAGPARHSRHSYSERARAALPDARSCSGQAGDEWHGPARQPAPHRDCPVARWVHGVGIAAPGGHDTSREAPVFFRDDVAARLSGTGGRADLIAVVLAPSASRQAVAVASRPFFPHPAARDHRREARRGGGAGGRLSKEDAITGLTVSP